MSAVTATIDLADDSTEIVAGLLQQFPRGSRVKLLITEVRADRTVPSIEEYKLAIAAARQLVRSPWGTTAEALKAIREEEE